LLWQHGDHGEPVSCVRPLGLHEEAAGGAASQRRLQVSA